MLKPKFNFKFSRFSLIALLFSLTLLLNFQNCGQLVMTEEPSTNKASGNGQGYDGLSSSGNGQGYDGFAATTGVYYQYIDQVKCSVGGNAATYSSKIDFGTVSAPLNTAQVYHNECSNRSPINISTNYLSYKPYSDKIITYEKGIYEKFSSAPTNVSNAPILFCQTTSDVNTGLDVLVRRNGSAGDYTAEIYLGLEQQNSGFRYERRYIQKFNVLRSTSVSLNTIYRADYFNMLSRAPNSNGISDGSLSTTIDGVNYSNLSLICKQQAPVSDALLPRAAAVNVPPTVDFNYTCSNQVCNFTSIARDTDGTIASYAWTFGDSFNSAAVNPSHTYRAGGTYNVSLTVTDNSGATANVVRTINVASTPVGPTINLIVGVDGSTDMFILANNTRVNFTVQGLGVGASANIWTNNLSGSTGTIPAPVCPALSSYTSASSQGWVINAANEWTLSQVFSATGGTSKSYIYCFYNSSNGLTGAAQVIVNP